MSRRGAVLSWSLIAVGIALLAFWAVARLHGVVMRRADLASFERAREASQTSPLPSPESRALASGDPDVRLWAEKRVQAYRESLTRSFAPPLAVLRIPRLGLEVPVLEGTDDLTLNRGVGHIAGTPPPGHEGNVGIAGHRDGFFRCLKDVAVGDTVDLALVSGNERYVVESVRIVDPDDVSVLDPTPEKAITLVTCWPFYHVGDAPRRCIVRAVRTETAGPPVDPTTRAAAH